MKEYKDCMDFKNRIKRAPYPQFEYYDDIKLGKESLYENEEQELSGNNVEKLDSNLISDNINVIEHNEYYVDKWDYTNLDARLAKPPVVDKLVYNIQRYYTVNLEAKKAESLVIGYNKSQEKYNIPKYSSDQPTQTQKITSKYESKNISNVKFIYLNSKSESGEEKKYDIKTKQVNVSEIEKTQVKKKGKLKT